MANRFPNNGCLGGLSMTKTLKKDCCNPEGMYLPGDVITWIIEVKNATPVSQTVIVKDNMTAASIVGVGTVAITKVLTGAVTGSTTTFPLNNTLVMPANSKCVYTLALTVGVGPMPSCPYSITNTATISQGVGCDRVAYTDVAVPAFIGNDATSVKKIKFTQFDQTFDWAPRTRDMTALVTAMFGGSTLDPNNNDEDFVFAKLSDFVINGGTLANLIP
jgi:hypothetical protein